MYIIPIIERDYILIMSLSVDILSTVIVFFNIPSFA